MRGGSIGSKRPRGRRWAATVALALAPAMFTSDQQTVGAADATHNTRSFEPQLVTIEVAGGETRLVDFESHGRLPVTILSSPTFDATRLSLESIVFAGAHPTKNDDG